MSGPTLKLFRLSTRLPGPPYGSSLPAAPDQVVWRSGIVPAKGTPADFLSPDNPSSMPPNWGMLGAATYPALWGSISAAALGDWTLVSQLEALYDAARASYVPGPIFAAITAVNSTDRADIVSLLDDSLNQRKNDAYTFLGGKMNRDRAIGWLLIRATRGAAQSYVPGLPSEDTTLLSTQVKMVKASYKGSLVGRLGTASTAVDGERSCTPPHSLWPPQARAGSPLAHDP